jgi:uncharacterized protein
MGDLTAWQQRFEHKAQELYPASDPSHDILHIRRVVRMALELGAAEKADPWVVMPAAYFHDFVNLAKDDPRRAQASRLSALAAVGYLNEQGYPAGLFNGIAHAIEAHSFSAGIVPTSIEAKVVQDADRLDALGAIGIARCFTVGAKLARPLYAAHDVLAEQRVPDDTANSVDHFFIKLFKLPAQLQTAAARAEGERRVQFMQSYLKQLKAEAT